MKKNILFSLIIINFLACSDYSNKKVTVHIFSKKTIPENVLNKYLISASLPGIQKGVDSFEVRIWYPFYYTDSFPSILQRVYYHDKKLKATCYVFATSEGKRIRSIGQLKKMKVEKYQIEDVPLRFLDSLRSYYNLGSIDSFDLNIIEDEKSKRLTTATSRNVLFEQSSPHDYYAVFISNPVLYKGLHPSIDKYANFFEFIYFSIFLNNDKNFSKWFDAEIDSVYFQ